MIEPRLAADALLLLYFALTYAKARARDAAPADRRTTVVLAGCYCIAIGVLNTSAPSTLALPAWAAWAGIVLSALGLVLSAWTRFSAVGMGPYRIVRYPEYLAGLAICGGATAASANAIALFTVIVAMLAAYAVRIAGEEAAALRANPRAQKSSAWRFIPFVY